MMMNDKIQTCSTFSTLRGARQISVHFFQAVRPYPERKVPCGHGVSPAAVFLVEKIVSRAPKDQSMTLGMKFIFNFRLLKSERRFEEAQGKCVMDGRRRGVNMEQTV